MNCPLLSEQTANVLLDFTAGRLDQAGTAKLETHMQSCVRCAAFRAEQTELWAALDAWDPHPVSVEFNRRLWWKIDQAEAAPWHRKLMEALRFGAWKPAFPIAAAVVVVVAGFLFDHPGKVVTTESGSASAGVSLSDADQVEKTLDDIQLLRQFDAAASSGNSTSSGKM